MKSRVLYYTRELRSEGTNHLARALAVMLLAMPVLAQQVPPDWTQGLELRREQFTPAHGPAVPLQFFIPPGAGGRVSRMIEVSTQALEVFGEWFGAYPYPQLTVVDASWGSGPAGASYPGVVVIRPPWLLPGRDLTLERSLLAAVARQYWIDVPIPEGAWFHEALVLYAGTRGIHEVLASRNVAAPRFFGGFIPFPQRGVLLSPRPWDPRPRVRDFAEVNSPAEAPWRASSAVAGGLAQRAVVALFTLERYIGWPALQGALLTYRQRLRQPGGPPMTLEAVVSEQRGQDLRWFFADAFSDTARFDYGVDSLHTGPSASGPSSFASVAVLRRYGDGVFAGTSEPRNGFPGTARSLPVVVRFRDGAEVQEWLDGRDEEWRLSYEGPSPVVAVSIDPDRTLLLDADRSNNTARQGAPVAGVRLVMYWLLWLQDVMLSRTALL